MGIIDDFRDAGDGLGHHPQDHGWRSLYRLFSYGLNNSAPNLTSSIHTYHQARPTLSPTHMLTLLGIALKVVAPESFEQISADSPAEGRLLTLEGILYKHGQEIAAIVNRRQNSFTAARRFLLPQVLLSAYFSARPEHDAIFADLGTGLGILPRQLDSRQQYEQFARDLIWPNGTPAFREISLRTRLGVDRGPLPDLSWVHACYGSSQYYARLYDELLDVLHAPDVTDCNASFEELDILNLDALDEFICRHHVNVANLSYVLYELDKRKRAAVIELIIARLQPPGLLMVSEPHQELHGQGTVVELYHEGNPKPRTICFVSDGHFKGHVIPLDDYDQFTTEHPIAYE